MRRQLTYCREFMPLGLHPVLKEIPGQLTYYWHSRFLWNATEIPKFPGQLAGVHPIGETAQFGDNLPGASERPHALTMQPEFSAHDEPPEALQIARERHDLAQSNLTRMSLLRSLAMFL